MSYDQVSSSMDYSNRMTGLMGYAPRRYSATTCGKELEEPSKLVDRQLHQSHHRGYEGTGHHAPCVDKYIQTLQKNPAVNTKNHRAKTEFVTNATIDKIIKLLRCAFKQAVRWELVPKNPFDNVILPKVEHKKRDIWTADMIRTALDQCTENV